MKKIYYLLLLLSLNVFSQVVEIDINGNFKINGTSSVWWSYRYRPLGSGTYINGGTVYSSSTTIKLNPFITYEFSRNFYNSFGQPTVWEADFVINGNYPSILPKSVGYSYDFEGSDLDEGWRGYRLQNVTSNTYSNVQEVLVPGYSVSGESLYMGWVSNYGVMLVSPKISDLSTDKKFSFYIDSYQGNYNIQIGTISNPYDPSTFHPLSNVSLNGGAGFQKVDVFMNNYQSGDSYIAIKSQGTFGDIYIDDFTYEQSVNCFDNTNLNISNITQSTALINFDADINQTSWEVYKKDVTHNIVETFLVNQTPFLLENLTGETTYEIKIRANCAVGLYSNWTPLVSFATPCENINSGYSTSFLESSYIDPCWTTSTLYSNIYQAPIGGNTSIIPRTGTKYIQMYNSSTSTSQKSFLITPYINDLDNNKRIKFYLVSRGDSDYNLNPLVIGTLSNPNDTSTFVPFSTISPLEMNEINGFEVNDYWKEHIVYLDSYNTNLNHNYIAIKQGNIGSTFHIDDFTYEDIPSCKEPFNLKCIKTDYNYAEIVWDNVSSQSNTFSEIEYGPTGFVPGTGTIVVVNSNTFILTNLNSNQEYDFYVRNSCSSGYSDWSDRGTFKTRCEGVYAGYVDGFETGSFDTNTCWRRLTAQIRRSFYSPNSQINYDTQRRHTGNKSINLYHINAGIQNNQIERKILVTPRLIDFDNEKKISFWSYLNLVGATIEIGTLSNPDDFTTFTLYKRLSGLAINQWIQNFVDFSTYYGTDKYVGIRIADANNNNTLVFIDDFEYLQNDCTRPSNLMASQISLDGIELSWQTNRSASIDCQIEYGEIGFTPGTGTIINTTSIPTIISGLNSNTKYQFRVRNNCSSSTINWSDFYDFKSSCYVTSPYYENFDTYITGSNVNLQPNICWTTNENWQSSIYMHISNSQILNFTSSPNSLKISNSGEIENAYLISPYIGDFNNNKKLKFWVLGQERDAVETISVGTIKNPLDLNTYEEYQTIDLDDIPLYGKEIYVDFENYSGSNKMFVIKLPKEILHPPGIVGNMVEIDNVIFEDKNGCKEPINIHFTQITNNSALVEWDNTNGSLIEVEYGLQGFIQGTGVHLSTNLNELNINGLLEASNYDFYFKTVCNVNNSVTIGPIKLTTSCSSNQLPWIEDFRNLSQYGTNILPECFKYLIGNFNLKNSPQTLYSNSFYNPDHIINGYDDSTYLHFFNNYSTRIHSPVFNLISGVTYKFSLQARKSYQYSPMQILMSVGRGQESHYMETDLGINGVLSEYNYNQLDYYYTPIISGTYSFLINPIYSGSVNLIADNFELKEGYETIIDNSGVFDFQNGIDNRLILESTQTNVVNIVPEINNTSNKVLRMSGSNNNSLFKISQGDIWLDNQRFISKVDFKISSQNFSQLYLSFRLKQTYKDSSDKSRFRVVVNGVVLNNEIIPLTSNSDNFETYQYDLTPFLGQDIRVSLQHIGESNAGNGDNAYLDDLTLSSALNSEEFTNENLSVYPNPTNNVLNILGNNIYEVSIYNLRGQVLMKMKEIEGNNIKLNLSNFENGIYLAKILFNNNVQKTIKVIKK